MEGGREKELGTGKPKRWRGRLCSHVARVCLQGGRLSNVSRTAGISLLGW